MPGRGVLPRLFFLLVRIFIDLGSSFVISAIPSDMFPGGGGGTRTWSSLRCSREDKGLDCIFFHSFMVLLIISKPYVVFSFFRGLDVIDR
jgi:hypothetical protein